MRIITFILLMLVSIVKINAQVPENIESSSNEMSVEELELPPPDYGLREEREKFEIEPRLVHNVITFGNHTYFKYFGKDMVYRYDTVMVNSEKRIAKKIVHGSYKIRTTDMVIHNNKIYIFELHGNRQVWTLSESEGYFRPIEQISVPKGCLFDFIRSEGSKIVIVLRCNEKLEVIEYNSQ